MTLYGSKPNPNWKDAAIDAVVILFLLSLLCGIAILSGMTVSDIGWAFASALGLVFIFGG